MPYSLPTQQIAVEAAADLQMEHPDCKFEPAVFSVSENVAAWGVKMYAPQDNPESPWKFEQFIWFRSAR